jgi:hypothetical protein
LAEIKFPTAEPDVGAGNWLAGLVYDDALDACLRHVHWRRNLGRFLTVAVSWRWVAAGANSGHDQKDKE